MSDWAPFKGRLSQPLDAEGQRCCLNRCIDTALSRDNGYDSLRPNSQPLSNIRAPLPLRLVFLMHRWRNPNVVSRWHTVFCGNWVSTLPALCSPLLLRGKCVGSNLKLSFWCSPVLSPKKKKKKETTLKDTDIFHYNGVAWKNLFFFPLSFFFVCKDVSARDNWEWIMWWWLKYLLAQGWQNYSLT